MPGFSVADNEHDRQTSMEARLGNDGEKLKWVLGAYYFNEHQSNIDGLPLQEVVQGVTTQNLERLDLRTRSYAAFGEATFSLTDRFRLTGGLRYTYERKLMDGLLVNYNFPRGQRGYAICHRFLSVDRFSGSDAAEILRDRQLRSHL